MELVAFLRGIARHPLLVAVGMALAVLVAVSAIYRVSLLPPSLADRTTTGGTATARTLLSTVDGLPYEEQLRLQSTVPNRGTLVADLAATEASQRRIARLAGIPRSELAVFGPAAGPPAVPVPVAKEAAEVGNVAPVPSSVRLTGSTSLPIITVRATAPDTATASRLAEATRTTLVEIARARSGERQVLRLQPLGPVSARPIVNAPKKAMALIAFVLVAATWCGGVALFDGLRRRGPAPALAGPRRRRLVRIS